MSARPSGSARCCLVMGLLSLALGWASTAPAGAATWTGRQLAVPPTNRQMFAISCPTASFCVAVGGGNTLASSTDPAGGAGSWEVAFPGGGGPDSSNQRQIKGVSCPSPQLCVAVTFEGLIYASTDPTGGDGAWSIADLSAIGPNMHMYGISCPSPAFCAVAAGDGKILTSTNPTGGAGAWSLIQLEGPLELRGVSCTSPALCVVVGDDGDNIRPELTDEGEILSSTNPLGGIWQRAQMPGAPGNLYGVACPSPALCVTGNTLGNLLVSSGPTGPAPAWKTVDGGGAVQITGADCPSASQCAAVDNNGDVLTSTDPAGGPRGLDLHQRGSIHRSHRDPQRQRDVGRLMPLRLVLRRRRRQRSDLHQRGPLRRVPATQRQKAREETQEGAKAATNEARATSFPNG